MTQDYKKHNSQIGVENWSGSKKFVLHDEIPIVCRKSVRDNFHKSIVPLPSSTEEYQFSTTVDLISQLVISERCRAHLHCFS